MASRDYTDSPLFRQFIDRLMRENGLNPNQAASYLNMVLNASARNEDKEGTFRMGASDFSRLKRGLSQYGRGLDADFLRRTRSAKELGELTEDEQIMLNLLNAANSPRFLGTMREGVNAVAGGERDPIQKAAMNYIQTFTLGNGDPRGGVGRIQRAMDGGSTAYGNDPLAYYNDTLLPRFNQITSDVLKEGKFLASTEITPQITRRKESVRNYDYGGLYPIAQDFSPNEFVEYNVDDNVHYITVTSRPGTNDISYKYAIPDYDIAYNNEYGNAERMFRPIENVVLYDRIEPFSQESVLLNDTLEFVPEKIAELQQRGAIIPYSNARINQGNLNTSLDQIGRGWTTSERSENFLNEYGISRGRIARLRLQGLQEGWLRRTQPLGPNWQGYRGYNEQDDLALEEEFKDARNRSERFDSIPESERLGGSSTAFRFVDPYEKHDDVIFENAPNYGPQRGRDIPENKWDDMTGGYYIPGPGDWIPEMYSRAPMEISRKSNRQRRTERKQQTVPQKDLARMSRDAQRTIENTPYGAPFERLGARQNNPFNIRHFKSQGPWIGEAEFEDTPEGGYKTFATREIGLSQGIRQVVINDILRRGLNTTSTLFKRFAPRDNVGTDPVLYANNMARNMGIDPSDTLDPLNEDQMAKLIMGILIQETQNEPRYTDEEIRNAYRQVIQTARERGYLQ